VVVVVVAGVVAGGASGDFSAIGGRGLMSYWMLFDFITEEMSAAGMFPGLGQSYLHVSPKAWVAFRVQIIIMAQTMTQYGVFITQSNGRTQSSRTKIQKPAKKITSAHRHRQD
jgi:hypothetical protein